MRISKDEKLACNKECSSSNRVSKRVKKISQFLIPKANQDWLLYK